MDPLYQYIIPGIVTIIVAIVTGIFAYFRGRGKNQSEIQKLVAESNHIDHDSQKMVTEGWIAQVKNLQETVKFLQEQNEIYMKQSAEEHSYRLKLEEKIENLYKFVYAIKEYLCKKLPCPFRRPIELIYDDEGLSTIKLLDLLKNDIRKQPPDTDPLFDDISPPDKK